MRNKKQATQKANERRVNYLTLERLTRLLAIYQKNKWPIEDPFFGNEYDKFCKMLTCLNDEEQDLIIELTQHFLRVECSDYFSYFMESLEKFFTDKAIPSISTLLIAPLIRPSDFGKSKSATALYYLIKSQIPALRIKYGHLEIKTVDAIPPSGPIDPLILNSTLNGIICLVDDFIGTGHTAGEAVNHLFKKGVAPEKIVVIALVAQEQGLKLLESLRIKNYVTKIRKKGITDNQYLDRSKEQIMTNIEKKMGVSDKFRFGYGRSEALVKMLRTPNNTFPIYWYNESKTIPNVPFPR